MGGRIGVALLGVVTVKIITNYLSESEYGAYSVVYDFLAMFGIAADFGLFTIGVREMAHDEKRMEKIIGNILGIRFTLAVVVLSLASFVGSFVFKGDPEIVTGIMISALATFLALMQGTIASVLQVKLKMQYVSAFHVIGKLVQVGYIALVAFILFGDRTADGFYQLLTAGVIANGVMLIGNYFYARREVKLKMRFDMDYWKEIIPKALPYGFALALATIYLRVDSFMLSKMRGKEEVAYYAVAVRVLEAFRILPLYFMNSALPSLTRAIKRGDGGHNRIIQYSVEFMAALSLPILVGGFLIAYNLVALVSSPDYLSNAATGFYGSDMALKVLLFEVVFSFLNAIFVFTLIAMNRHEKTIWINGGAAALNVLLNLWLIPVWGFIGAGITTVASEAFVLLLAYVFAKRHLDFKIGLKNLGKIVVAAGTMGIVLVGVKFGIESVTGSNLIVIGAMVAVGAATYAGMLLGTKAITPEMLKLLKKPPVEKEAVGETNAG